jgi:hypothetical protein
MQPARQLILDVRPQRRIGMEWLGRPLVCDGAVVAGLLDPARLGDSDLRDICLRMHVILETVEMPRCEGWLIPRDLFDAIDTLRRRLGRVTCRKDRPHRPDRPME